MNNDDFSRLLRRAIEGEVAATSELLTRCEPEIQRIVRANLPRKIRSKFDSMDFVQAVWKSVLTSGSIKRISVACWPVILRSATSCSPRS